MNVLVREPVVTTRMKNETILKLSSARWDVVGGALSLWIRSWHLRKYSKVGPPPPVMLLNVSSNKSDSSLSCIEPISLCLDIVLCVWETVVLSVGWRLESGSLNTVFHISVKAPRAKATPVELLQLWREWYPGSQKPKNAIESVILHNKPHSRDLWDTRVAASAQAEAAGFLGRGVVQSGDW